MTTKKSRAVHRVASILALYVDGTEPLPEAFVVDLLTDIRHYCDAHHVVYSSAETNAYRNYLKERNS